MLRVAYSISNCNFDRKPEQLLKLSRQFVNLLLLTSSDSSLYSKVSHFLLQCSLEEPIVVYDSDSTIDKQLFLTLAKILGIETIVVQVEPFNLASDEILSIDKLRNWWRLEKLKLPDLYSKDRLYLIKADWCSLKVDLIVKPTNEPIDLPEVLTHCKTFKEPEAQTRLYIFDNIVVNFGGLVYFEDVSTTIVPDILVIHKPRSCFKPLLDFLKLQRV